MDLNITIITPSPTLERTTTPCVIMKVCGRHILRTWRSQYKCRYQTNLKVSKASMNNCNGHLLKEEAKPYGSALNDAISEVR